MVFRDPWMTVRVKGVVACEPFNASANPPGLVVSQRHRARIQPIDSASVSPPESVAVSRSSR
jgi:hypothetical protein